jgi:RNA polymerase sigma-70 factor (sigma-E family)
VVVQPPERREASTAAAAVTALYQAHALGLMRLAHIVLGDRQSAEDVVQEAFCGLYRRWDQLSDTGKALQYVRSSVINGCRSVQRRAARRSQPDVPITAGFTEVTVMSAEADVLTSEERRQVMQAVRRLPGRQREALVLQYYLDLSADETAAAMGISPSTVRSATHRALSAVERMLQDRS